MLSTPAGGYTSIPGPDIRPDLLPSGLYRRLRSFTGSWGVQAFYALSVDGAGYLGHSLAGPFTFPDFPALARALATTPRGLYRRWGIGKARNQLLPSPCPEGRAYTQEMSTLLRHDCQETECPDGILIWDVGLGLAPARPSRRRGRRPYSRIKTLPMSRSYPVSC
jgi:hypothetical protein